MFRLAPVFITIMFFSFSTNVFSDPYIGIGAGAAYYKVDFSALGGGALEDNGTSTKFYGGYAFNEYLAAELTYYDFAKASVGAVNISDPLEPPVFISASVNMKGYGAYAVGLYPVTRNFNLLAKLGLVSWQADLNVDTRSAANSGTDAAYAFGASYALTKELHVTAEWESFNADNPEVSTLTLGFKAIFR